MTTPNASPRVPPALTWLAAVIGVLLIVVAIRVLRDPSWQSARVLPRASGGIGSSPHHPRRRRTRCRPGGAGRRLDVNRQEATDRPGLTPRGPSAFIRTVPIPANPSILRSTGR